MLFISHFSVILDNSKHKPDWGKLIKLEKHVPEIPRQRKSRNRGVAPKVETRPKTIGDGS